MLATVSLTSFEKMNWSWRKTRSQSSPVRASNFYMNQGIPPDGLIQVGQVLSRMKYRSRFEIASSILNVALTGNATKTRLMYGSFLSFAQINEYLAFLLANMLITRNEESRTYTLTEKGMRFLHIYEDLTKLIPLDEPVPAA